MRRLLAWIGLAIACFTFNVAPPALAGVPGGSKIFSATCVACHLGGRNLVSSTKTLKLADLQKNQIASVAAITAQVTAGKGAMPSFKGRLTKAQIADVSAYVLAQAEKGW